MLVDSHCHLDKQAIQDSDLALIIERAKNAGVGLMQTICTNINEFEDILLISNTYNNVYCSFGIHPTDVKEVVPASDILRFCESDRVVGIGETGLDYYRPNFDKNLQRQSFIEHIIAAQQSGLPIIIHSRSADEDMVAILKEAMNEKKFSGVIHCFTASRWLADECIKLGLYISASGIITFSNATDIQNTFKEISEDRILIETDSPFLAPVPYRGKVNEPSYLKETALFLAKLRGISYDEIARITTENFFKLFNRARKPIQL